MPSLGWSEDGSDAMPYTRCHLSKIVAGLVQRIHRAMADPADHAVVLNVGPPVLLERVMNQVADPHGDHRAGRSGDDHATDRCPRRADAERAQRRGTTQ